ncbi:VanZ family protein [Thioalkalivibrio sp. ALE28]|uniref:VanZ family protein n=1 Tax=Thioalkalivibrio sp. ALE28 TaxID=1158179 RepID=UPI0003609219|nr:VanZ family protein [Thioalkalivibrio sp. ALE28]
MSPPAAAVEPLSLRTCALWAWLSLGAAIYLTLLPFEFGSVSLERAWEIYRGMSLTGPGTSGRQQFMANALMFLPLGFFWTAWLTHGRRNRLTAFAVFTFVAALGLAVTASVEFLQVWLPYRHPAGADIAGNFSGAVAGSLVWLALRDPLVRWRQVLEGAGAQTLTAGLVVYAVLYVLIGFVPFDFVLAADELRARLASDAWGWWVAAGACTGGLRCISWLTLEVVVSVPVGLLLALWLQRRGASLLGAGIPLALLLAGLLELLNLATLSGIAEGRSVLLRALGMGIGLVLFRRLPAHPHGVIRTLQQFATPLLVTGAVAYALLLVALNHGFGAFHADGEAVRAQWADLNLWPFYYHYHVDEIHALRSTALHLAMYAPLGMLVWLWQLRHPLQPAALNLLAVVAGAVLALAVEAAKLFVDGARPDPASLVLAGLAAGFMAASLQWLERASVAGVGQPAVASRHEPRSVVPGPGDPGPVVGSLQRFRQALGGLLALVAVLAAVTWPVAPVALAAGLLVYAVLLAWRPQAWLVVIPVVLATLDLTLYHGRLFVSELDLFLLMTLAVALWRGPHALHAGVSLLPRGICWPLGLLVVSTLIGLALALWPPGGWNPGAAVHFAHEWNALRVAKGLLWAVVLLAVLRVAPIPVREQVTRWFLPGVALALLAQLAFVVRERITYPGLLDFDSGYRLSGLFSEMQAGGPSIESFLVLAFPLALIWFWRQRPGLMLAGAAALAVGTAYAVAMTYSRGGYLGLVVAVVVLAGGVLLAALQGRMRARGGALIGVLLSAAAIALIAGTTLGGFAEQRLGQIERDFGSRVDHWQAALELPGGGPLAPLLGRGVGSFPEHYRTGNRDGRLPGNLAFTREEGEPRLQLGGGDSLFVNQRVDLPREGVYRVTVEAASARPAGFRLFLCEKPIRHSFACRSEGVQLEGDARQTVEWTFDLDPMGSRPWPFQRGLVLSLAVDARQQSVVEFYNVQLRGLDGREYVANGDFRHLGRHWYFTTDHLWPWRVENQWLELYFDQGWLGLVAFVWLTLAALTLLVRRGLRGDAVALAMAAALAGALTIGLFSTLFFSPRIALLFYLVLLLGVASAIMHVEEESRTRVRMPAGSDPKGAG